MQNKLILTTENEKLLLHFVGELSLYDIPDFEKIVLHIGNEVESVTFDFKEVDSIDTAFGIFFLKLQEQFVKKEIATTINFADERVIATLEMVKNHRAKVKDKVVKRKISFIDKIVFKVNSFILGIVSLMSFFGELMMTKFHYLKSIKNVRFKEIAFEINESGIKAIGIVSLTSFLIGLVVAYQSAYQLKAYGANIFIVDMLGISILRELAPLITAIVIAGRSGSAFTAQIGAMKITQELDAMKSMGFDPFAFLVLPRIIALMITLPILIFLADIMGIFGGMIVAHLDLDITTDLFLERFREVVDVKHFFIGLLKGPFFAFLIASIGIYRGLMVKDDTQSIGFNTTKSVVESIFAVIVCDAVFSIIFTSLGI